MYGISCATAFFMTRALFTTWGRNILPDPNRSPTTFIPSINGPSMTASGLPIFLPRLFNILLDVVDDTFDERMLQPLFDRLVRATRPLSTSAFVVLLNGVGECEQSLRRVGRRFNRHVLDQLKQIFRNFFVNGELAGIDDAHIQAGMDRVIQKCRMHGFADDVVATERKRYVADAAADLGERQLCLDAGASLR